jgi:phosphate transport system permease protein
MGIMITPMISSLSDDAIKAVPQSLKRGSLALGMTKAETIKDIIIPSAMPGIISASLLGMSKALGETMIVVMAAGMNANKFSINILEDMTTVTVQIVTALTGDFEFDSPDTLSAFALGLVLFVVTLILNIISVIMIRRFKKKYKMSNL